METNGEHVVLVVDDEPANQRAVRRALMDECRVAAAGGGEAALAAMRSEAVSLVIVDQRMPGMNGTDFLRHTIRLFPRVIRIVLTAYTDVDTLVEAINTGHVYHFLSKPWEARELRQVVRRGLERYDAERERLRLVGELQAACARAQREVEQKTRLLTMVTHELGTPVHIVLNAIALLMEFELAEGARRWADMAQRASGWLARGIAQLNTAARIREHRFQLRPELIDLRLLVRDTVDDMRAAAEGRRLEISAELPPRLAAVEADPHWLRQAISNLLTNAVRFTPDGGSVRVEAREEEGRVLVAVCDSGVGIAPAVAEDIFAPFSSAMGDPLLHGSGWLSFGARGLGLGLALVREIAQVHGGGVGVSSSPGCGSRFTLWLPKDGRRAAAGGGRRPDSA